MILKNQVECLVKLESCYVTHKEIQELLNKLDTVEIAIEMHNQSGNILNNTKRNYYIALKINFLRKQNQLYK